MPETSAPHSCSQCGGPSPHTLHSRRPTGRTVSLCEGCLDLRTLFAAVGPLETASVEAIAKVNDYVTWQEGKTVRILRPRERRVF